jgi:hypothetical protein
MLVFTCIALGCVHAAHENCALSFARRGGSLTTEPFEHCTGHLTAMPFNVPYEPSTLSTMRCKLSLSITHVLSNLPLTPVPNIAGPELQALTTVELNQRTQGRKVSKSTFLWQLRQPLQMSCAAGSIALMCYTSSTPVLTNVQVDLSDPRHVWQTVQNGLDVDIVHLGNVDPTTRHTSVLQFARRPTGNGNTYEYSVQQVLYCVTIPSRWPLSTGRPILKTMEVDAPVYGSLETHEIGLPRGVGSPTLFIRTNNRLNSPMQHRDTPSIHVTTLNGNAGIYEEQSRFSPPRSMHSMSTHYNTNSRQSSRQSSRGNHNNFNPGSGSPSDHRRAFTFDHVDTKDDGMEHNSLSYEAFLANGQTARSEEYWAKHVAGRVVKIAQTHNGSVFLQRVLGEIETKCGVKSAHQDPFFRLIWEEMKDQAVKLMVDNVGHFAIEKLMVLCSSEQIMYLVQVVSVSIDSVACQKHGSFSVQVLVDRLSSPEAIQALVDALKPNADHMICSASGHFVILHTMKKFNEEMTRFIDEAICNNLFAIAKNRHGLRVIKKLTTCRTLNQLQMLINVVMQLAPELVEDQYGNYVIQEMLGLGCHQKNELMMSKLEGKFVYLSKQKFSSNVVECCLKKAGPVWRKVLVRELTMPASVAALLSDRYGNYVLQTALSVCDAGEVRLILDVVSPHVPSLRENVRNKWRKLLAQAVARGM